MLCEGGRAKRGPDHKPLRGVRRPATCLDPCTSLAGHARLSGSALLPLSQVHPSAQLDLVGKGIQLRVFECRPAAWSSPDARASVLSERRRKQPPADPDRRTERVSRSRQTRRSGLASPRRPNLQRAARRGSGAPPARVPRQPVGPISFRSGPLIQFWPAVLWGHRPSRATPIFQDRMPILQSLRLILCKRSAVPNGCASPRGRVAARIAERWQALPPRGAVVLHPIVGIGPPAPRSGGPGGSGTALA
jgi:hypothetical protein